MSSVLSRLPNLSEEEIWAAIYTSASLVLLLLDKKHLSEDTRAIHIGAEGCGLGGCGCLVWLMACCLFIAVTNPIDGCRGIYAVIAVGLSTATNYIVIRNRWKYYYWIERSLDRTWWSRLKLWKPRERVERQSVRKVTSPSGNNGGADLLRRIMDHPLVELIGLISALLGILGFLLHLIFHW